MRKVTRRQVLAGATGVAASSLTTETWAQGQATIDLPPGKIGSVHTSIVRGAVKALKPGTFAGIDGARYMIGQLPPNALSDADRQLLEQLLKVIHDLERTAQQKLAQVRTMLKQLGDAVRPVIRAIIEIAESSLQSAVDSLANETPARVIVIVAADVVGAIAGAATAGQLFPNPAFMALAAAAGGVAGSATMWLQFQSAATR